MQTSSNRGDRGSGFIPVPQEMSIGAGPWEVEPEGQGGDGGRLGESEAQGLNLKP